MMNMGISGMIRMLFVWTVAVALLCAGAALADEPSVWIETFGMEEDAAQEMILQDMEEEEGEKDELASAAKISGPEKIVMYPNKPVAAGDIYKTANDDKGNPYTFVVKSENEEVVRVETDEQGTFIVPVAYGKTNIIAQIENDSEAKVVTEVEVAYDYKINLPEYIFVPVNTKRFLIDVSDYEPKDAPLPVCTWNIGGQTVEATWIRLNFGAEPGYEEFTITPPSGESLTIKLVIYKEINNLELVTPEIQVYGSDQKVKYPLMAGIKVKMGVAVTADGTRYENAGDACTFTSLSENLVKVDSDNGLRLLGSGTAKVKVKFDGNGKTKEQNLTFDITNTLILPANINTIEEEAFAAVEFTAKSEGDVAVPGIDSSIEAVYIPDGCEYINARAFANCRNLKYIRIPSSLKGVLADSFEGCQPGVVAIVQMPVSEGFFEYVTSDEITPDEGGLDTGIFTLLPEYK